MRWLRKRLGLMAVIALTATLLTACGCGYG
jgi:hypothetical protein